MQSHRSPIAKPVTSQASNRPVSDPPCMVPPSCARGACASPWTSVRVAMMSLVADGLAVYLQTCLPNRRSTHFGGGDRAREAPRAPNSSVHDRDRRRPLAAGLRDDLPRRSLAPGPARACRWCRMPQCRRSRQDHQEYVARMRCSSPTGPPRAALRRTPVVRRHFENLLERCGPQSRYRKMG